MPDGNNGSEPSNEAEQEAVKNFELHTRFTAKLWEVWQEFYATDGADPHLFSRVTEQSLLHMAATLAVDTHQPEHVFRTVAEACHKQAFKNAQKFT